MSDMSDLDEDIDKILNELTFETKKEVKNEMESKRLPSNGQQSQKTDDNITGRPERENSAKSRQRRGSQETLEGDRHEQKIPTSDRPPSPKVTRRYGAPPQQQQEEFKGSNLLANIFSATPNDEKNKRPPTAETTKPSFQPPSATKVATDTPDRIKPVSMSTKDAASWLGLGSSSSPLPARKEISNDDGDDDILRTLRTQTQLGGGGESQTRQRAERPMKISSPSMADDKGDNLFLDKINAAKKLQQPTPTDNRSSFEDKLPLALNLTKGPSLFEDKFSFNAPTQPSPSGRTPQMPIVPANPPPAVVAAPDDTERKAFLQNLFGGTKSANTDENEAKSGDMNPTEDTTTTRALPKKRVVVSSAGKKQQVSGGTETSFSGKSVATLQVPSHLIDEDELKTMSSSLKCLYTNQLDMMDKSYSEQMACMTQSHLRKEDMLKEEIKIIHKDYESRLERLKSQLLEVENKSLASKHQEESNIGNSTVIEQLKVLQNKIDSIEVQSSDILKSKSVPIQVPFPAELSNEILQSIVKDVDHIVNTKLNGFENSLRNVLDTKFSKISNANPDTLRSEIVKDLTVQIEKSEKKRRQEIAKFGNAVVEGMANTASKLSEVQKKVGENVGRKMLDSIGHTMEMQRTATAKNKDKSYNQIKEFREDLRRFSSDMENRNDTMRKFHGNLEGEQKQIAQNLQDLNNWLQVHFTRNSFMMNAQTNMHNLDNSLHSEMEIQLLKDERKSLSEYMAEINVERRKLAEEKIALGHERRELERERSRVQDLEITLKMKLSDAEELQNQVETARKENYRLGGDIVRQQNEAERDRLRQKECLRSIEENLRTQYENVLREKMDILREKEFFEKLRSQLLCPGCLKSLGGTMTIPGQPIMPPAISGHNREPRSIGDGLEKPIPSNTYFFQTNPIRIDEENLNKEIKFLDDLYLGYSPRP